MKIGLLGGSFNPPHQGHIHISNLAIKKLGLNQVWWIPTAYNPLKERNIYENYQDRLNKCQILTKTNPNLHIKAFDEVYTVKLVKRLRQQYKNTEFFWIMGADNLEKLHQWDGFKKLISNISLAIFSRGKTLLKIKKCKAWKAVSLSNYQIFYTKNLDISSTQIRNKND